MKTQLLTMLIASMTLVSCEKYETPTPTPTPTPDRVYHLSVEMLDVSLTDHASYDTKVWVDGTATGSRQGHMAMFRDTNDGYDVTFCVFIDHQGVVHDLSGTYNGKTFVLYNGRINICNGVQGAPITFSIH